MREQIIQKVLDKKIVAIVRGVYGEDCVNLARALCEGGIELLEVTFDQSKPELLERTSDTIRQLVQALGDKMIFGAGTVTTVQMLELERTMVMALNFMDEVEKNGDRIYVERLSKQLGIPVVPITAKTGEGLEDLKQKIAETLQASHRPVTFHIPFSRYGLLSEIRPLGRVITENHTDTGTELTLMIASEDAERLVRKYGSGIISQD